MKNKYDKVPICRTNFIYIYGYLLTDWFASEPEIFNSIKLI